MAITTVDTQNVTLTVDSYVNGVPEGNPSEVICVMGLGNYKQTRSKKEYNCMSSSESSVSLGSISRAPLSFDLLYNEVNADGQQKIKNAFANNTKLDVKIEFANTGGVNGTIIEATMGVAEYDMGLPKDGKIELKFSLEFDSAATITPAG